MPITKEQLSAVKGSHTTFIETGTSNGQTIDIAIQCGFRSIITVELSERYYRQTSRRFHAAEVTPILSLRYTESEFPTMTFHLGDSADVLNEHIIPVLSESAVFWSDAHLSAPDSAQGRDICPVIREMQAIARSPIKTHTILVDDFPALGVSEELVRAAILEINPAYHFSLMDAIQGDGSVDKGWILVARTPEKP